jgi:hypothetical protein
MSSLATQTIKKIFRETFTYLPQTERVQGPIWVEPESYRGYLKRGASKEAYDQSKERQERAVAIKQQQDILKDFKTKLAAIEGIKTESISKNYMGKPCLDLTIELPSKRLSRARYTLQFDKEGYLELEYYSDMRGYIQNTDVFVTLREALYTAARISDERFEIAKRDAPKKEKLKNLKKAAIVAKLKDIAETENVKFAIDDIFATKVRFFAFFGNTSVEMNVPLKDFQNSIRYVQLAVRSIKELIENGISIKVK